MLFQVAKFHSWLSNIHMCVCMCVCMYHVFFIHSSVDGHLCGFHSLAIVNKAAMNIEVHVSFQISVFVFFKYMLRSGIAGYCGSSSFHLLRNFHTGTVLQSTCYHVHLINSQEQREANPIPYQRVYEVVSLRDQLFINLENKTH